MDTVVEKQGNREGNTAVKQHGWTSDDAIILGIGLSCLFSPWVYLGVIWLIWHVVPVVEFIEFNAPIIAPLFFATLAFIVFGKRVRIATLIGSYAFLLYFLYSSIVQG